MDNNNNFDVDSINSARRRFAADLAGLCAAAACAEGVVGRTWPNPPVGCVVVAPVEPRVVGRGAHPGPGQPHAEVLALAEAGSHAVGATAYVTLEPCNHQGRTPPCVSALLAAKVARVVFALGDPNAVAGGGAAALRKAGVDVAGPAELAATAAALDAGGVACDAAPCVDGDSRPAAATWGLALERVALWCAAQMGPFLAWHRLGRAWIAAKWAMSLDGRIATRTGASKWITGEAARLDGRRWRARLGSVVVGIGTAVADDPRLTYRGEDAEAAAAVAQPCRVVLDTEARLSPMARLLAADGAPRIVAVGEAATADGEAAVRVRRLEAAGATVLRLPEAVAADGRRCGVDLAALATALPRDHGVYGMLLEGGATLLGSAFDANLVDYALAYIAPTLVGGREALAPIAGLGSATLGDASKLIDPRLDRLGGDWRIAGHILPAGRTVSELWMPR